MLVHFTVALITISTVFFVLSKISKTKSDSFVLLAKGTLWTGAGITLLTVLAGFDAFSSVAHDDVAHKVMKTHRMWALVAGAAVLVFAFWTYRAKSVSSAMVVASLIVTGLIGTTGYFGAELVYRHGLGVMRLPVTSGEGHDHAGGNAHDEADAPAATDGEGDQASAEGHDHSGDNAHDEAEAPAATDGEGDHASEEGHSHESEASSNGGELSDPAAVAEAFSKALEGGDVQLVDALLDDAVLIIEGGHAQVSKAEYMGGHMKSDMAFLPNMTIEVLSRDSGQAGDVAWVTTHSRMTGTYKEEAIDTLSRGFLLMRRVGSTWKITHIQWASK